MFSAQRALFGQSCSPLSVLGFYALVPQGWSLSYFPDEVAPSVLRSARLHFFRGLIFRKTNDTCQCQPPVKVESVFLPLYKMYLWRPLSSQESPITTIKTKPQRFPLMGSLASVMHQSILAPLFPCWWSSRACWPDGFIQHLSFCWDGELRL